MTFVYLVMTNYQLIKIILKNTLFEKNRELYMEFDFGFEFHNAIKSLERFFDNLKKYN
jgi:hypothetical protein